LLPLYGLPSSQIENRWRELCGDDGRHCAGDDGDRLDRRDAGGGSARLLPVLLVSFAALPIRGVIAFYCQSWWGVFPIQILDGVGRACKGRRPGVVARSLKCTGRSTSARAPFSPCRGSAPHSARHRRMDCARARLRSMFLTLGGFGLVSVLLWIGFARILRRY